jgi:hypothetical protein
LLLWFLEKFLRTRFLVSDIGLLARAASIAERKRAGRGLSGTCPTWETRMDRSGTCPTKLTRASRMVDRGEDAVSFTQRRAKEEVSRKGAKLAKNTRKLCELCAFA